MPFEHGRIMATNGIVAKMEEDRLFSIFVKDSLARHLNCDWGDLSPEDLDANERAYKNNDDRLFSAYIYDDDQKIWIITEYDRSATTILFPSEY